MPKKYTKDPDARLDYSVDWSLWLDGDTIASSSWDVPDGLVKVDESDTPTSSTVWLSGGTAGEVYEVTNHIETAALRADERTLTITVEER